MSDGMVDVHRSGERYERPWMSDQLHQQQVILHGTNSVSEPVKLGRVKILEVSLAAVTISLDLPADITMRPSTHEIPKNITLLRQIHGHETFR